MAGHRGASALRHIKHTFSIGFELRRARNVDVFVDAQVFLHVDANMALSLAAQRSVPQRFLLGSIDEIYAVAPA